MKKKAKWLKGIVGGKRAQLDFYFPRSLNLCGSVLCHQVLKKKEKKKAQWRKAIFPPRIKK